MPTHTICGNENPSTKYRARVTKFSWSRCDLDLWPLILKIFSAIPTHMMNICAKFHWNSTTKYRDIASREIGFNVGRTTAGRTVYPKTYCPLHGRFADKPVRWQDISLTRWQDRNSVDKCIHLASCQRIVLSAKWPLSEIVSEPVCQRNIQLPMASTVSILRRRTPEGIALRYDVG